MLMEYNETDVDAALRLYRETQRTKIETEIERLRNRIDNCDDIWIRGKLAKKVRRLQVKLNTL